MPYCRRCGAQLEENAHFCHKCGTPVITFVPILPPPAAPTRKKGVSPEVIAIIAVVVAVVIVSIFVFSLLYSAKVNQTNDNSNQGNSMSLGFNTLAGAPKANVLAQNLNDKTSVVSICARRLLLGNLF